MSPAIPTGALATLAGSTSAREALTCGAGAAMAVLLYFLLAEPGQRAGQGLLRRLGFAALGTFVFLALIQPRHNSYGNQGRAFESYVRAGLEARQAFATNEMLRGEVFSSGDVSQAQLNKAIRHYEATVRASPESSLYQRECAVVYAAAGRWTDARRAGLAAAAILAQRGDPNAAGERAAWEAATGAAAPNAAQETALQAYARRHGWFGRVLLYAVETRLGRKEAAKRERAAVGRAANRQVVRILVFGVVRILLAVLGGLVLIVLAIMIGTRVARPIPATMHPVSAILWEGFLLYMFLSVAPAIPRLLGRSAGAAPQNAATVVGMALLTDSLGFLAIGYLWWRLRGRGLTLAEIGLRARRLPGDFGWGILAYVASQPVILIAAILTEHLTQRYFPNVPPPYHPVIGLMLGSSGFWVRAGLLALLSVGAPLFEEIFFRGALHGALRRRFGGAWGAVLSAGVFAILHPQLPLGFVPIFLLGFSFSLLYEWRKSLIPGMVMHALNNGLIFMTMDVLFSAARW